MEEFQYQVVLMGSSTNRFPWVMVLLAMAVGMAIRLGLAEQPLWIDELHTSWTIADSLSVVAGRAADGNQAPFYFWANWLLMSNFDLQSPILLRLLSLIAGSGVLLTGALLIWNWTRDSIATIGTSWMLAIDHWLAFYGSEARPYVLLQLLAILQAMAFWNFVSRHRVSETKQRGLIRSVDWWLILLTALLFFTHYTAIWLLLTEFLFLILFVLLWREKLRLRGIILTVIEVTVVCSIGIPHMIAVYRRRGNWETVSSIEGLARELWLPGLLLLFGSFLMMYQAARTSRPRKSFESAKTDDNVRSPMPPSAMICFTALWFLIPIVAILACDYLEIAPLALIRYSMVGWVAFPILCGLFIGLTSEQTRKVVMAVIFVLLFAAWPGSPIRSVVTTGFLPAQRGENWEHPMAQILSDKERSNQPVLLLPNLIEDVDAFDNTEFRFQRYLKFPVDGIYRVDTTQQKVFVSPTLSAQRFSEEQLAELRRQQGGWVLIRGTEQMAHDAAEEIEQAMQLSGDRIATEVLGFDDSVVFLISIEM